MLELLPAKPGIDRKATNNILKINDLSQNLQMEILTVRYCGYIKDGLKTTVKYL